MNDWRWKPAADFAEQLCDRFGLSNGPWKLGYIRSLMPLVEKGGYIHAEVRDAIINSFELEDAKDSVARAAINGLEKEINGNSPSLDRDWNGKGVKPSAMLAIRLMAMATSSEPGAMRAAPRIIGAAMRTRLNDDSNARGHSHDQ